MPGAKERRPRPGRRTVGQHERPLGSPTDFQSESERRGGQEPDRALKQRTRKALRDWR